MNGFDFSNNSDVVAEADRPKMGTVVHRAIVDATSGPSGVLTADADWVVPDGIGSGEQDTLRRIHDRAVHDGAVFGRSASATTSELFQKSNPFTSP